MILPDAWIPGDAAQAASVALAAEVALLDLDAERSTLYRDILSEALSEAARRALQSMNPEKYQYRSEFAKRYYGQGLASLEEALGKP